MVTNKDESGLVQRGLILFAGLALIAGVILFIIFSQPGEKKTKPQNLQAHHLAVLAVSPTNSFPGNLPWAPLVQILDAMPSSKGRDIRYNATIALARRGSEKLNFAVLLEMLDEKKQMLNFQEETKDGTIVVNETKARRTVILALKAFSAWHKQNEGNKKFGANSADLININRAVDQLTKSSNPVVRTEAERLRKQLEKS